MLHEAWEPQGKVPSMSEGVEIEDKILVAAFFGHFTFDLMQSAENLGNS